MMNSKKSRFLIALALLSIGVTISAMEPVPKKTKKKSKSPFQALMTRTAQSILDIYSKSESSKKQSAIQELHQNPSFLSGLPEDVRKIILGLLIRGATAETLEIATFTINSLVQVNHELNTLFNNPQYCLQIIKNLSQRFHCPNSIVCKALQTKQANIQLKIQTDFLRMCHHARPQEITFTKLCTEGLDIEFTYLYEHQELTPLMLAILLDNRRIFAYLLNAGANINHANSYGTTPLMIATTTYRTILSAYGKGLPLAIEQLVINPAIAINQKDRNGNTALMIGLLRRVEVFKLELLLGAGADPETVNNNGDTPLSIAQASGDQELIDLIKDAIARQHV